MSQAPEEPSHKALVNFASGRAVIFRDGRAVTQLFIQDSEVRERKIHPEVCIHAWLHPDPEELTVEPPYLDIRAMMVESHHLAHLVHHCIDAIDGDLSMALREISAQLLEARLARMSSRILESFESRLRSTPLPTNTSIAHAPLLPRGRAVVNRLFEASSTSVAS